MTVGRLKRILEEALEELKCHEDNVEVKTVGNTYFAKVPYGQFDSSGFISLLDMKFSDEKDWD